MYKIWKTIHFSVIGDNGIGKSTFINRLATGDFISGSSDAHTLNASLQV